MKFIDFLVESVEKNGLEKLISDHGVESTTASIILYKAVSNSYKDMEGGYTVNKPRTTVEMDDGHENRDTEGYNDSFSLYTEEDVHKVFKTSSYPVVKVSVKKSDVIDIKKTKAGYHKVIAKKYRVLSVIN